MTDKDLEDALSAIVRLSGQNQLSDSERDALLSVHACAANDYGDRVMVPVSRHLLEELRTKGIGPAAVVRLVTIGKEEHIEITTS